MTKFKNVKYLGWNAKAKSIQKSYKIWRNQHKIFTIYLPKLINYRTLSIKNIHPWLKTKQSIKITGIKLEWGFSKKLFLNIRNNLELPKWIFLLTQTLIRIRKLS